MEMLPASIVLILASVFCKSRLAKWVLLISALPGLLSLMGMIASFGVFAFLGCTGSPLDQHTCSPGATETVLYAFFRPAVMLWFVGTFAAIGVAIVGGIVALVLEFGKRTGVER